MNLRNPGAIQPAPPLRDHAGMVAARIGEWPGVAAFTRWQLGAPGTVDGAEFHVGEGELGHIHLDDTAHIPLGGKIAAALHARGLGRSPSWSDAWITLPVRSPADVDHAAWLFRIAYDRHGGASDDEVLARINAVAEKRTAAASPSGSHDKKDRTI